VKTVMKSAAPAAKPASKLGIGSLAKSVKAQGEMKTMMARPKTGTAAAPKVKPNREQKARAAGMVAAQRSRKEGAKMSSYEKANERMAQRAVNYLGQEFSDKANRYNGLSDSQLSDKKKK